MGISTNVRTANRCPKSVKHESSGISQVHVAFTAPLPGMSGLKQKHLKSLRFRRLWQADKCST